MTDPQWFFERKAPMGGAGADAFRNTLSGQGIPGADLFVREAIQNSVDAAVDRDATVEVSIVEKVLSGSELSGFLARLGLDHDDGPAGRTSILSTDGGNRNLQTLIGDELRVLFIEDRRTKGLTGREEVGRPSKEDRFRNLCLELGSTAPPEPDRGGTYGFGKSVYWVSSNLWTVVLHSRFAEVEEGGERVESRTMGVSWFRGHSHPHDSDSASSQYTGRAWFGEALPDKARPLRNEDADRIAEELGFSRRGPDETGLSIAILGCSLELDGIREGVEKWWWPRILEGRLRVRIVDRDGNESSPTPRADPTLGRLVRAWDLLHGECEATDGDSLRDISYKRLLLGRHAITSEGSEDERNYPDDGNQQMHAMIRSPGMVVHYLKGPQMSAGHPMCAGIFQAHSDRDVELANSEPPAHNRWDHNSTRAERPLDAETRKRIENLYKRVKEHGREFLREHREEPPEPPDRNTELEKMLGRFFSFRTGTTPQPDPRSDPFSIRFLEGPDRITQGSATHLRARIGLRLKEDSGVEELPVSIRASVVTVRDRNRTGERVAMESMRLEPEAAWLSEPEATRSGSVGRLTLVQDNPVVLELRSEPLSFGEYRADLEVDVSAVSDDE